MTKLREPHKAFERSGGKPVATLKNAAVVGKLVPSEAVDIVSPRGKNGWLISMPAANAGELPGRARDTSRDAALAQCRPCPVPPLPRAALAPCGSPPCLWHDQRHLRSCGRPCHAIAHGHWLNDDNKHTAYRVKDACLVFKGITIIRTTKGGGQIIICCAQG